jgi:hypothetical protein
MTFIASMLLTGLLTAHPLHISYTNIEINTDDRTVAVSHKIFTNDFTLLFYHLFEKTLEPQNDKPFTSEELQLIDSYMSRRFMLCVGTDTMSLKYERKDQDDESVWLYYSGKMMNSVKDSLVINNLLLLDLFFDQTNLVIVTDRGKEEGYTFDFKTRKSVVKLNEE